MLDEEVETFTDKLSVEVSVRLGDNLGCQLTTVVGVDKFLSEPSQARVRLNKVIDVLLKALPVEALRGLEKEYYDRREVTLNKDGQMVLAHRELTQALRDQNELKKRIQPQPPLSSDSPPDPLL